MGGKGKKRREKNYRAAHGGNSRLPPPPDASRADALPSKLRQIISFASSSAGPSSSVGERRKRGDGDAQKLQKRCHPAEDAVISEATEVKDGGDDGHLIDSHTTDHDHKMMLGGGDDKAKKKRKRGDDKRKDKRKREQVEDLRFGSIAGKTRTSVKRRERRKKHLEAKKKKHKKSEAEDLNFPGYEQVKFGDVVQAPPKLIALPKALKNVQDASRERLRLQAIEAYRNRKGWKSRPGLHLPSPLNMMPSL
uniref:Uncharacterized protein MANES_05G043400 n=1 Tax=Rhizophora mucronata TaxID=61149 RepID=A0A2P2JPK8_RHIMU